MSEDFFAGAPRTNLERMRAGDLYIADDPEIVERLQRAARLSARYRAAVQDGGEDPRPILADLLGHVGEDAWVRPPLWVDYGGNISLGARCSINYNLTALDVAPITIGEDTLIGPNVQLLTPTHPLDPRKRRAKLEAARPIAIGDNVWIGGGAIVLPGVSVGDDSVIGAGSVVTKDVPPGVVAMGNPARVVRSL